MNDLKKGCILFDWGDTNKRIIAAAQLLLIFPAALFLTAVLVRYLQPLLYGPAHLAGQIVMWFSVRQWTLWVLLIGLPLAALILGGVALLRKSGRTPAALQSRLPVRIIAAATVAAGLILAVVALHMLAN